MLDLHILFDQPLHANQVGHTGSVSCCCLVANTTCNSGMLLFKICVMVSVFLKIRLQHTYTHLQSSTASRLQGRSMNAVGNSAHAAVCPTANTETAFLCKTWKPSVTSEKFF